MPVAIPLAIVGAGVASAAIGSSAAKSAAKTQASAAEQATNVQQQMFNQTQANLAPFRTQGVQAGSALAQLLGTAPGENTAPPQVGAQNWTQYIANNPDIQSYIANLQQQGLIGNGPNADYATPEQFAAAQYANTGKTEGRSVPTYTAADVANYTSPQQQALENLPGYQFTRNQGVQQVNRALGSMGETGAQAKGISRFVTGLADSTYNSQVQNLQNATNTGEAAAAGQAQSGANFAGGISNTITGTGAAQAAGIVGGANAITAGLSSIPGALLTNSILNGGGNSSGGIYIGAPGVGAAGSS
jgi:hypothetical protein